MSAVIMLSMLIYFPQASSKTDSLVSDVTVEATAPPMSVHSVANHPRNQPIDIVPSVTATEPSKFPCQPNSIVSHITNSPHQPSDDVASVLKFPSHRLADTLIIASTPPAAHVSAKTVATSESSSHRKPVDNADSFTTSKPPTREHSNTVATVSPSESLSQHQSQVSMFPRHRLAATTPKIASQPPVDAVSAAAVTTDRDAVSAAAPVTADQDAQAMSPSSTSHLVAQLCKDPSSVNASAPQQRKVANARLGHLDSSDAVKVSVMCKTIRLAVQFNTPEHDVANNLSRLAPTSAIIVKAFAQVCLTRLQFINVSVIMTSQFL